MIELLIIRHAETAWNTADVFRGRVSIELSEVGLKQAGLMGEYLSEREIQAIYCSPLKRAVQTAEFVARHHKLTPQPMENLNDLDFGEWGGLSRQEVKIRYKDLYEQWLERPDLTQIPGGESLEDARKRSLEALDQIMSRHNEGTVAIITHRVITKILACALLGLDNSHFWNIEQDTGGITTFIHNGRCFILTHHNDVSFLKPAKADQG
jgi:broad specificity phosphatase PhoE